MRFGRRSRQNDYLVVVTPADSGFSGSGIWVHQLKTSGDMKTLGRSPWERRARVVSDNYESLDPVSTPLGHVPGSIADAVVKAYGRKDAADAFILGERIEQALSSYGAAEPEVLVIDPRTAEVNAMSLATLEVHRAALQADLSAGL